MALSFMSLPLCEPCNIEPFPDELPPGLANAADPPVFFENTPDLGPQGFIVKGAVRQASRISPLSMRQCLAFCAKRHESDKGQPAGPHSWL